MSNPTDLLYTEDHEWALVEGDVITVGITNHAQDSLGDVVFVELPDIDQELGNGDSLGVVESVKAVPAIATVSSVPAVNVITVETVVLVSLTTPARFVTVAPA